MKCLNEAQNPNNQSKSEDSKSKIVPFEKARLGIFQEINKNLTGNTAYITYKVYSRSLNKDMSHGDYDYALEGYISPEDAGIKELKELLPNANITFETKKSSLNKITASLVISNLKAARISRRSKDGHIVSLPTDTKCNYSPLPISIDQKSEKEEQVKQMASLIYKQYKWPELPKASDQNTTRTTLLNLIVKQFLPKIGSTKFKQALETACLNNNTDDFEQLANSILTLPKNDLYLNGLYVRAYRLAFNSAVKKNNQAKIKNIKENLFHFLSSIFETVKKQNDNGKSEKAKKEREKYKKDVQDITNIYSKGDASVFTKFFY